MIVAQSPLTFFQIKFQVGIVSPHLHQPGQRLRTKGRPAEVSVNDDTRGVYHPPKPVTAQI